jgi:histidyl-tRNA synthetase
MGVAYTINPTLVRGLDYYTRTVWEFVNDDLDAAQSTVCAGGRYDGLIEEIGGKPTPGIGWAAGVERLALSLGDLEAPSGTDVFVLIEEPARRREALVALAELRARGHRAEADYAGRSVKGQLTQAQRLGARTTLLVRADGIAVRRRGQDDIVVATIEEAVEQL